MLLRLLKNKYLWKNEWHIWLLSGLSICFLSYEFYSIIVNYLIPVFKNSAGFIEDYQHYHEASLRFIKNPSLLYLSQSNTSLTGFIYPPLSIIFFLPFSFLPLKFAYLSFMIIGYIALVFSIVIFVKILEQELNYPLKPSLKIACILISLAFAPTFMNAIYGQVNTLVLFFCVFYIWLAKKNKPWLAGLILSLSIWLKLYPIFLVLLSFFNKTYRKTLPSAMGSLILYPILSLFIIPFELYYYYFFIMLPNLSNLIIVHVMNQSLMAILTRLFLPFYYYKLWGTQGVISINIGIKILNLFFICFFFLYIYKFKKQKTLLLETLFLAMVPMFTILGWGYTYVMVLPLGLLLLLHSIKENFFTKFIVLISMLLFIQPSYSDLAYENCLPIFLRVIFYSRYLLSALILFFVWLHMVKSWVKT